MALYTKVGDEGFTRFPDGRLGRKDEPRVVALGEVDELNTHIGLCVQRARADGVADVEAALAPLQAELFVLGGSLVRPAPAGKSLHVHDEAIARMEKQIDEISAALPPLTHFILPGGSELSCRLHLARCVCRRAERAIVASQSPQDPVEPVALRYINRLSDLLFALARQANHNLGVAEELWQGQTALPGER